MTNWNIVKSRVPTPIESAVSGFSGADSCVPWKVSFSSYSTGGLTKNLPFVTAVNA
jgi:hypothetical protein